MANTFLLTLATLKPVVVIPTGGVKIVRGTVTMVGDNSGDTAAAGEVMKFRSLTQGPNIGLVNDATTVHIISALQMAREILAIVPCGPLRLATAADAAIAYNWTIDPLTGLLLVYGSSATAGELRQQGGGSNIPVGTFSAQFLAWGY